MPDLGEMLSDGRVHVVDGAMGTMLYARGVFMNVCYDELNATDPDLVEDVHEQYVRAGAQIVETNTFGANPVKLSSYGLDERTEELNAQAARLALRARGGKGVRGWGGGTAGSAGGAAGADVAGEAREYFGRQVDGLLEGGVEGFFLETFSDLAEMEQAFLAVRSRCALPVVVQATVGEECATGFGATVEQAARAAEEWGADAAGLNCSVGPAVILDGVERMAATTRLPLSAQPNAGLPRAVGDRKMYLAGPEYMAMYARRLIRAGARLVGGCCGTTPEHVRRIRRRSLRSSPGRRRCGWSATWPTARSEPARPFGPAPASAPGWIRKISSSPSERRLPGAGTPLKWRPSAGGWPKPALTSPSCTRTARQPE